MDFNEFAVLMARKLSEIDQEEEIQEAFRVFDKNRDGSIPEMEMRNVFKYIMATFNLGLSDEEIDDMIKFIDTDTDGLITYPEFANAMMAK